jgi:hypothetical protein
MALSANQLQIEEAIRHLCLTEPFVTIEDITKRVPLSRQTVLDNVDAILAERPDIKERTVGQANVYYIEEQTMEALWSEQTESTYRLDSRSEAGFAELRRAPEEDEFDFHVHWYDHDFDELEDYIPTDSELGQAMGGWESEPVAIKF